jgi:hypothetical protein
MTFFRGSSTDAALKVVDVQIFPDISVVIVRRHADKRLSKYEGWIRPMLFFLCE